MATMSGSTRSTTTQNSPEDLGQSGSGAGTAQDVTPGHPPTRTDDKGGGLDPRASSIHHPPRPGHPPAGIGEHGKRQGVLAHEPGRTRRRIRADGHDPRSKGPEPRVIPGQLAELAATEPSAMAAEEEHHQRAEALQALEPALLFGLVPEPEARRGRGAGLEQRAQAGEESAANRAHAHRTDSGGTG